MHLYTGILTASTGQGTAAAGYMTRFRDAAIAATGNPASAWAVVAGAPYGTFALSTRVDGMAQLLDMTAALGASEEWNALALESASAFAAPAEVVYTEMVAATSDDLGQHPLMSVNRSKLAPGKIQAGVAAAVDILEFAAQVTGVNGMLAVSDGGESYELSFIFGVGSGAEADAANAALAANPEWVDKVDQAGELFIAGSGHRMYLSRLP